MILSTTGHWLKRRTLNLTPPARCRCCELQGVVMAVRGVTSAAAVTLLGQHSRCQGVSVDLLAEQVMGSLEQQQAVITVQVLDALLAGHVPPQGQDAVTACPPGPPTTQLDGSALHLMPTGAAGHTSDTSQAWAWQAHGLTRRESQVLALIGRGLSNRHIATALFLTDNTVKSYIRNAYRKIGVLTRTQAVRWAIEHEAFLAFPRGGVAVAGQRNRPAGWVAAAAP